MFIAKCIQDGRRVDLPLSRPLFKLLCSSEVNSQGGCGPRGGVAERQDSGGERQSPCNDTPPEENSDQTSNVVEQAGPSGRSNRPQTPHPLNTSEGETSKEAEVLLCEEIPKDRSCKREVLTLQELEDSPEAPWFSGVLDRGDLEDINPYRAKFLNQLDKLVCEREKVLKQDDLSSREREDLLNQVVLPGDQENLPGTKLEDLW